MRSVLAVLTLLATAVPAVASTCYAFVERWPGARYASLDAPRTAALSPEVVIMYVGHSTYRIETPQGVVINTDYFGSDGPGKIPDIVTMNHAHETHWTAFPNEAIAHVLRGWNPAGDGPAEHRLRVGDVTVRNVTTDILNWGVTEEDGNSIFVFEVADLCIGHLGHLHHPLSEEQYALLGRLDVLMVPIDGVYTLNLGQMIDIVMRLKSSVVLPMHAFGPASFERFIAGMSEQFAVRISEDPVFRISADTLPSTPTVVALPQVRFRSRPDLGLD